MQPDAANFRVLKGTESILSPFAPCICCINMVYATLTITKDRGMIWNKDRDSYGTQKERHSLGRFIIEKSCHLPVTVEVKHNRRKRPFSFAPCIINDTDRKVILTHRRYKMAINFDDVVKWIRIFITSNKMYEQELFQFYT